MDIEVSDRLIGSDWSGREQGPRQVDAGLDDKMTRRILW
jgi:hypothetical protein